MSLQRLMREHALAHPPTDRDDRRHVKAMIGRVELAAHDAHEAAEHYGFAAVAERIEWALDFLADAAAQVKATDDV